MKARRTHLTPEKGEGEGRVGPSESRAVAQF